MMLNLMRREIKMANIGKNKAHNRLLLADLQRAIDLVKLTDESKLSFEPNACVSADISELIKTQSYPTDSHLANLQARFDAVAKAGDKLAQREPSEYVTKIIVACIRLAPPSDD